MADVRGRRQGSGVRRRRVRELRAIDLALDPRTAAEARTLFALLLLAAERTERHDDGVALLEETTFSTHAESRCRASLLLAHHWGDLVGDRRRARAFLLGAVAENSGGPETLAEMATLLGGFAEAEGEDEVAIGWYGRTMRLSGSADAAAFHAGVLHQRNGRDVEAVTAYERVLARRESEWQDRARMNLATMSIQRGRVEVGISRLRELATSASKDATLAAYVLAEHTLSTDRAEVQRSLVALADGTDEASMRAKLALSREALASGDVDAGLGWAARAATQPGGETVGRSHLAAVLGDLGRIDEARDLWEEIASDGGELAGDAMESLRLFYREAGDPDRAAWWAAQYDARRTRHRSQWTFGASASALIQT